MADKAKSGATDATSVAQARFTVQLPADVRPMLDAITEALQEALTAQVGMAVDLSMAQVVGAVIKARYQELETAREVAASYESLTAAGNGAPEGVPVEA